MMKTFISKQFTLEARDWLKSLFYAVIVPVLLQVQSLLENNGLSFDWTLLAQVALSAAVAHIIRKFTEKSKVITVKPLGDGNTPPPIGDPTHPNQ